MLNKKQSELLGILLGDGSMSKSRYSANIVISGHKHEDREYLIGYVRPMFEELFDRPLKTHFIKNENSMTIDTWSKQIASTLNQWGCRLA